MADADADADADAADRTTEEEVREVFELYQQHYANEFSWTHFSKIVRIGGTEKFPLWAGQSDAVFLTLNQSVATMGLADEAFFSRMRPHAILINVARVSELIHEFW